MTEQYDNRIIRYDNFDDMNLSESLLRGIYAHGFEMPSLIQKMAIPTILTKHDVIAQAQSGTGKTGAFLISSLNLIDVKLYSPQVLILAPTRELGTQIYTISKSLNVHLKANIGILIGGNDEESRLFKEDSQIIIGTPGKVGSMLSKGHLRLEYLKIAILDEADEMLSTCFKDQVYDIFQFIPKESQICIFSATISQETLELTHKFMNDPIQILVKNEELTLEGITQYYINVEDEQYKFDTLADLYKFINVNQTIIYCNSKKKTQYLYNRLTANNFTASCIHSNMTQFERNETIKNFRNGSIKILLATDIIARGLDVQHVSTVINYELPVKKEIYIHRIGRSGRFGRQGTAINLITKHDFSYLKQIQSYYNTDIQPFEAPELN